MAAGYVVRSPPLSLLLLLLLLVLLLVLSLLILLSFYSMTKVNNQVC